MEIEGRVRFTEPISKPSKDARTSRFWATRGYWPRAWQKPSGPKLRAGKFCKDLHLAKSGWTWKSGLTLYLCKRMTLSDGAVRGQFSDSEVKFAVRWLNTLPIMA